MFQGLIEREEKNNVAIASNESVSGWTKTFTDPRLCAAIVDRRTFNGAIIQTGAEFYRLAHTKAQAERAQAGSTRRLGTSRPCCSDGTPHIGRPITATVNGGVRRSGPLPWPGVRWRYSCCRAVRACSSARLRCRAPSWEEQ